MKNSLRMSILTRDHYTCQYCGRRAPEVKLHVEHVISRHDGGADHPSNLVAACTDCNYGKGKRSLIVEELLRPAVKPLPDEYLAWLMGAVSDAHDRAVMADIRGRKIEHLQDVLSRTAESDEWYQENYANGPNLLEIQG